LGLVFCLLCLVLDLFGSGVVGTQFLVTWQLLVTLCTVDLNVVDLDIGLPNIVMNEGGCKDLLKVI